MGLHEVAFFGVDLQGKILRQVTGRGPDSGEGGLRFTVHGTVAGLAFQRVDMVTEPDRTGRRNLRRWWVPITDGVERLGVLRADTAGRRRDGPPSAACPGVDGGAAAEQTLPQ
ncbi:hypothetical protein AB0M97_05665 [Streptomyces sp. NPDC051207]|uniref:hypothetical protein n=1 Tax=Streptomyces sp. NPDC051207 TaxID=3154641 RepID=UPI00343D2071